MIRKLEQAIKFAKSGIYKEALPILSEILSYDPENEKAWICLALCIDDNRKRLECLQRVNEINPSNEQVKKIIARIKNGISSKSDNPQDHQFDPLSTIFCKEADQNQENGCKEEQDSIAVDDEELFDNDLLPSNKNHKESPPPVYHLSEELFTQDQTIRNKSINNSQENLQASRAETGLFGKTLVISGIKISRFEGPICLRMRRNDEDDMCNNCDYFSEEDCLLKFDDYLMEDINRITYTQIERNAKIIQRSKLVSKLIYDELKTHGRPLHYSMISKIIIGRYHKMNLTEKSIYHYIIWHPELFERVGEGVYKAK